MSNKTVHKKKQHPNPAPAYGMQQCKTCPMTFLGTGDMCGNCLVKAKMAYLKPLFHDLYVPPSGADVL